MAGASPRPSWPVRLAIAATAILSIGLVVSVVVALLPIWPCVLVEHFRVQYVAGGLVLVVSALVLGMPGYFDVALIATLMHLLWVTPDLCRPPRPIPPDAVRVRVLVLNVHTESSSFDRVRRLIQDVQPDVVGLVEVDERWLRGVAPAVASYAGRLEKPRADNFGVALYTRAPLVGAIEELGGALPSAVASVEVGGARLSIVLVHPLPPVTATEYAAQRDELDAVASRAREIAGPVVVMGDFNATPWSRPYRRLLARSGLCDSRAGFGIQATFPAASTLLRIPIDHLLASCPVGITGRRVERDVGSDHLPVVIDLAVPRRGP
jgi:endonuclease/exonuclease/phosphatase (EEP) superfamily protein YafD